MLIFNNFDHNSSNTLFDEVKYLLNFKLQEFAILEKFELTEEYYLKLMQIYGEIKSKNQ